MPFASPRRCCNGCVHNNLWKEREYFSRRVAPGPTMTPPNPRKQAFYANSSVQVLFAVGAALALGYLQPTTAIAMKPLGDAFIRLITMIITLIIFCTVVTGIAGMEDMKKVGRV